MILPAVLLLATLAPQTETPPPSPATQAAPAGSAQEHIDMGLAVFKKRRFAQAEEHFRKAVEADPSSAAAHFYLGYSIYKKVEKRPFHPEKQVAAQMFAKTYELEPAFRPVWGSKR